jgi:hypothetical protein
MAGIAWGVSRPYASPAHNAILVGMRLACCFVLCSAVGCVAYTPVAPRTGAAGQTRAHVGQLAHVFGQFRLEVQIEQAAPGARIREAVLARAESDPCRFGWAPAHAVLVGPGTLAMDMEERDVRAHDELTVLYTPENSKILEKGARLDLLILHDGQEECLTIPLTGSSPDLAWDPGEVFTMDLAMGATGYTPHVDGIASDIDVRMSLGWAAGKLRPFIGAGVGGGFCEAGTCPPEVLQAGTDRERLARRVGLGLPLFLGADFMPWQVGYFAFGTRAAYEFSRFRIETYSGPETRWHHGLTLAPRVAFTFPDPLAPGLPGGVNNGFIGFDLPLGFTRSFHSGDMAFRYGFRMVFSWPLG